MIDSNQISAMFAAQDAQMRQGMAGSYAMPGASMMTNPYLYGSPHNINLGQQAARGNFGFTAGLAALPTSAASMGFDWFGATGLSMAAFGSIPGFAASVLDPFDTGGMTLAGGYLGYRAMLGRTMASQGLALGRGLTGTIQGSMELSRAAGGMRVLGGSLAAGLGVGLLAYGAYRGVESAIEFAQDNVSTGMLEQSNLQQLLMTPNNQLIPEMSAGMSSSDVLSLRNMFSGMAARDPNMSVSGLTQLTGAMMQGGEFRGVGNIREFKEKFTQTLSALKEVSSVMHTSLEEAYDFMNAQKQMGIFSRGDQVTNIGLSMGMAQAGGVGIGTVQQTGVFGAQVARAYGGSPIAGAVAAETTTGMVGLGLRRGMISNEDLFMATGAGGEQGVAAFSQSMVQQAYQFSRGRRGRMITAALLDPVTGHIDPELANLYKSGGMDHADVLRMARQNLSTRRGRLAFRANQRQLAGEMVEQVGAVNLMATDAENILERHFGTTSLDPEEEGYARQILGRRYTGMGDTQTDMLMRLAEQGPRLRAEAKMEIDKAFRDSTMMAGQPVSMDQLKAALLRKFVDPIKEPFRRIGAELEAGMTEWAEEQMYGGVVTVGDVGQNYLEYGIRGMDYLSPTAIPEDIGGAFTAGGARGPVAREISSLKPYSYYAPIPDKITPRTAWGGPKWAPVTMPLQSGLQSLTTGVQTGGAIVKQLAAGLFDPDVRRIVNPNMRSFLESVGAIENVGRMQLGTMEDRGFKGKSYFSVPVKTFDENYGSAYEASIVGDPEAMLWEDLKEGVDQYAFGLASATESLMGAIEGEEISTVAGAESTRAPRFGMHYYGPRAAWVDVFKETGTADKYLTELEDRMRTMHNDMAVIMDTVPVASRSMYTDIHNAVKWGDIPVDVDALAGKPPDRQFGMLVNGLRKGGMGLEADRLEKYAGNDRVRMTAVISHVSTARGPGLSSLGLEVPGSAIERPEYYVGRLKEHRDNADQTFRGIRREAAEANEYLKKFTGDLSELAGLEEYAVLMAEGDDLTLAQREHMETLEEGIDKQLAWYGLTGAERRGFRERALAAAGKDLRGAGRLAPKLEAAKGVEVYHEMFKQMEGTPGMTTLRYVTGGTEIAESISAIAGKPLKELTREDFEGFRETVSKYAFDPDMPDKERDRLALTLGRMGPQGAMAEQLISRGRREYERIQKLRDKGGDQEKMVAAILKDYNLNEEQKAIMNTALRSRADLASQAVLGDLILASTDQQSEALIEKLSEGLEADGLDDAEIRAMVKEGLTTLPSARGRYRGGPMGAFADFLTELNPVLETLKDVQATQIKHLDYLRGLDEDEKKE